MMLLYAKVETPIIVHLVLPFIHHVSAHLTVHVWLVNIHRSTQQLNKSIAFHPDYVGYMCYMSGFIVD